MMRAVFLAATAFLSAVAIFLGCVLVLTSLKLGSITLSYSDGKDIVTDTVTRAGDAARFWRLFASMGLMPIAIGGVGVWYAARKLRGK